MIRNSFVIIVALLMVNVVFGQKINLKKGNVLVDKIEWGPYTRTGYQYFFSTLSGQEWVSIPLLTVGTGTYDSNGKEK